MIKQIQPTNYICVEDIFKTNIYFYKDEIHVSNLVPPELVEHLIELTDNEAIIVYFDPLELKGEGYTDLKKNGRVAFKLNKTTTIYKQTYYYMSKGKKKYKTTMIPKYIGKYCNYTKEIQNYPFLQYEIFHTSYRNTTELINKSHNLTISSQSIYLYQKTGCRMHLDEREEQIWKQIEELGIKPSGYYNYDEEYVKINKEVYVRLSIIDNQTYLIIKDILVEKDKFDKDYIKEFLQTSLNGLPLECIITDGLTAYKSIIDELGCKHQSCQFHIMQNLMRPFNRRMSTIERMIESLENQIEKKNQ